MSKVNYYSDSPPSELFIVICDGSYRIYVSEGQAYNYFDRKIKEGKLPKIYEYIKGAALAAA